MVRGWVKMSATMVGPQRKIKAKHWLKRPRADPKKTIDQIGWPNINDSKFHFLKILFRSSKVFIFVQKFQWTSWEFFLISDFLSWKPQRQQKLAKNITHFTIQFCSKNLTHFTKVDSLDTENNMLPQHS